MDKVKKVIISIEYEGQTRTFGLTTPEKVKELLEDNPGIRDLIETTLEQEPNLTN